ncbi:MAG TPA: DUF2244 domain-containing protein [Rhizomicrobium sp.]|nr:DUF2244 domain-containing protein [Rhizomicrobium sp.]
MRDPVLLDATLRPNPPLPPAALIYVLAGVVAINLVFATAFVLRGAWLVMPFMGLDIALLGWAFRASSKASRRSERITLTRSSLSVARRPSSGAPTELTLNPYWVRVEIADPPAPGDKLTLWSHGKGVRVGDFLAPQERAAFGERLKSALRQAREPGPDDE